MLGAPGTGKGTTASILSEKLEIHKYQQEIYSDQT